MKLPRLPEHPTIEAVAAWLTAASSETWTTESVLSRFLEWNNYGSGEKRAFAPETLLVVIHAGDELLDSSNEFSPYLIGEAQLFELCAPLDGFIKSLLLSGAGSPPSLTQGLGSRYRCQHALSLADVRFRREWVANLLPAYDSLMYEIKNGEHVQLVELAESVTSHAGAIAVTQASKGPARDKRIYDRANELRSSGVRSFLKTLVKEEGVTATAIKEAIARHKKNSEESARPKQPETSFLGQLKAANK